MFEGENKQTPVFQLFLTSFCENLLFIPETDKIPLLALYTEALIVTVIFSQPLFVKPAAK